MTLSHRIRHDENPGWRPSEYVRKLWGSSTEFRFPVIKILDYRDRWEMLEALDNPFAIVVQAHLKTLETQKDDASRSRWKITLTKELYKRGFRKADILKLFRFIDWIMILPDILERQYYQEIIQFEEGSKMPYITIAERIGIEKGMKEGLEKGREEGREEGKLVGEILLAQQILNLTIYTEEELKGKSIEDLKNIFEQFKAKLNLTDA